MVEKSAPVAVVAALDGRTGRRLYYPLEAIWGDYARSAAGAVLCLFPAFFVTSSAVLGLLLLVGGSFVAFGLMTWRRQLTAFRLDADNLYPSSDQGSGGAGRVLPWSELRAMSLSYFSVRGDGRNGWMQLKLLFEGRTLRVDSRLEDFEALAAVAAGWARETGIELDPATLSNLEALGIEGSANSGPGPAPGSGIPHEF